MEAAGPALAPLPLRATHHGPAVEVVLGVLLLLRSSDSGGGPARLGAVGREVGVGLILLGHRRVPLHLGDAALELGKALGLGARGVGGEVVLALVQFAASLVRKETT